MGKKKNYGGADAGGRNKKTRSQEVLQGSDGLERSLQKRSRFSTEHLKQLEELYREGLNLEEEILADEDLSEEELQGALDELEMTSPETTQQQPEEAGISSEKANPEETVHEEPSSRKTEEIPAENTVEARWILKGTEEVSAENTGTEGRLPEETEVSTGDTQTEGQLPEETEAEEADAADPNSESAKTEETEKAEETGEIEETDSSDEDSEELLEEELAELLEENEAENPAPADEDGSQDPEEADVSAAEQEHQRKSGLSKKNGMIQAAVFFLTLFGISIVGLCMPLRPTESQIEKRTLTEFPEFTWESFLSGDYTDQISTWYADTFPFRETLLSWYTDFKKLFGIQGAEVYIGDIIVADDIPDIPDEEETTTPATDTDASATDAEETATPEETTTEAPTTTTEAPTTATEVTTTETETTAAGSSGSGVTGEQIGSVYIYGDQAFSVYGFSLERSDNYASMISLAAEELAGKATVYNMLVPLSYGIQLDSSLWESMGWSDEEKAIRYMYSQMSTDVKTISVYQALLEHKSEYIYFRTDHHWTALGAYYAYQCFAEVKGITANALDSFETMTFENYLGSLYSQSNESEALANNPDTIIAYVPRGTNKMTITQKDGSILNWRVIYDVTSWRNDSKYSCFIGGDNPFSVIENPEITDGSSVLLVKESFGNAFAPFLVDHYQHVYIIDFRYYSGHLEDAVDTYGIQDVIFLNNLNSAGGALQDSLKAFIEPEEETGTQG